MAYILSIIARSLALVDGIMSSWTTTPTALSGACGTGAINVSLNTCGQSLAAGIEQLVNQAVPLLNNVIQALGAIKA